MKTPLKAFSASILSLVILSAHLAQAAANPPARNTSVSQAASSQPASNRDQKRLGAYLGILGDPHPTGVGVNLAYNVLSFMRASVGFGKISTGTSIAISDGGTAIATDESSQTTIGVATKWMMPGWNLTPAVTLGYSHVSLNGNFIVTDYKTNNFYTGLGADWQMESGFDLGAGINLSLNGGAPTAPYINVGVFF